VRRQLHCDVAKVVPVPADADQLGPSGIRYGSDARHAEEQRAAHRARDRRHAAGLGAAATGKQLTFDWVDEQNGKWERGRIAPADREHLADWLTRFDGVRPVGSRWKAAPAGGTSPKK
jgi:hypothetical protein